MQFSQLIGELSERIKLLDPVSTLVSIIPELVIIVASILSFAVVSKFDHVRSMARKLQRLNLALISFTSFCLIIRKLFHEVDYEVAARWLTYGINLSFFFIGVTDIFTLLAGFLSAAMIAYCGSRRAMKVWVFLLVLGALLSLFVTLITFESVPKLTHVGSFDFKWESLVYGVASLLEVLGAIACITFASYSEEALNMKWVIEQQCYVQVRYQFKTIRCVSKQAGYNSALKSIALFFLMFFHQSQSTFHVSLLAYLTVATILCFFCHLEARQQFLCALGLHKTHFGRVYLGARLPGQYQTDVLSKAEEAINALYDSWEQTYEEKQAELAALKNANLTWIQRLRRVKTMFQNISNMMEKNRVNPAETHDGLFMVHCSRTQSSVYTLC